MSGTHNRKKGFHPLFDMRWASPTLSFRTVTPRRRRDDNSDHDYDDEYCVYVRLVAMID